MITEQEFKRCLPASLKAGIDDTVRQQFNACLSDPNIRDIMGQNLIGYTSVLQQGKFKLSSYISAVRYCTYKSMGDTNILAYKKTFPDRYTDWENAQLPMIAIPTSILNQDVFQEAINVQRSLMLDPKVSPMVRCQSAKALMDCLKPEEVKQMELSVSVKESDTVEELRKTTNELAKAQLKALQNGADLTALLNAEIVEVKSDAE